MKTVAYVRVSTPQQDLRSQRLAILEYARAHDFRVEDFIEPIASGQASEKRRPLHELASILESGDRLVVSELSRLGRSLGQVVTILDALAKAGVALVMLKENIRVEGKQDIQTKVMTTLLALFAEVERELISEQPEPVALTDQDGAPGCAAARALQAAPAHCVIRTILNAGSGGS